MKYELRRLVYGSSCTHEIDQLTYKNISEAKSLLLEILFIEEKLGFVIDNFIDLELELVSSTLNHQILGELNYDWIQKNKTSFDRKILNLLASCGAYIDGAKHNLSNISGKGSDMLSGFNDVLSQHYDTCLGYRLMEELRNYAIHRGTVVDKLSYPSILNKEPETIKTGISIFVNVESLAEDAKFKKSVLDELNNQGEEIALKPLIRDYVSALSDAQDYIRKTLKNAVDSAEKVINKAISDFNVACPEDYSTKGLVICIFNDNDDITESSQIFDDFIQLRRKFENKYIMIKKLSHKYVTTECIVD